MVKESDYSTSSAKISAKTAARGTLWYGPHERDCQELLTFGQEWMAKLRKRPEHVRCNICRQEFNCLYRSPGGQLKNKQPSKAPPLHQRKSAQFLPCSSDRQRNAIYIEDS